MSRKKSAVGCGPFDLEYSNNGRFWPSPPGYGTLEVVKFLGPPGKVLDLGAGEGRDSIFLAKRGFTVTAVDVSAIATQKAEKFANNDNVDLATVVSDAMDFQFSQTYHIIVCYGLLHFLPVKDANLLLSRMKEHTMVGGYNVVSMFTDYSPVPECHSHMDIHLHAENTLSLSYKDWELCHEVYERRKPDQHPGYPDHSHSHAKVLARRLR